MYKVFYKARLENMLNNYNYYIYEITILDKVKNIYVASKTTNKVEVCLTGTSWQDLSEQVGYNLSMFKKL